MDSLASDKIPNGSTSDLKHIEIPHSFIITSAITYPVSEFRF